MVEPIALMYLAELKELKELTRLRIFCPFMSKACTEALTRIASDMGRLHATTVVDIDYNEGLDNWGLDGVGWRMVRPRGNESEELKGTENAARPVAKVLLWSLIDTDGNPIECSESHFPVIRYPSAI
jgi:hypothetical protein